MSRPSKFYRWEQGRQALTVGKGVCYGLCIALGKLARNTQDLPGAYDKLVKNLASTGTLHKGMSAQRTEDQDSRNKISLPLPPNIPLVILCNTASTSGYLTRYSLLSYLNPFAWFGNHACLMWHGEGGTLIFDPNTGVALWPTITHPDYAAVMKMLDWGYTSVGQPCPVYVWGFQQVYRGG